MGMIDCLRAPPAIRNEWLAGISIHFIPDASYYEAMVEVVQIDKEILGGTPCFAGTRVPSRSLFDHLKLGYTVDGFLEQFPTVKREQVEALLDVIQDAQQQR
jgi:uncharacterized protein (DUF433 family)